MAITIEKEIEEVVKLKEKDKLSFTQIGKELGFSERTARRRYAAAALEEILESDYEDFPEVEPLNLQVEYDYVPEDKGLIERFKPLTMVGDAVVSFDYHIPLHDPGMINVMIRYAQEHKIKNLIIGGDFFHQDSFGSYLPYQEEASLEQERLDGNIVMKVLLKHFDNVYMIWGNHDFRLAKKLRFRKSFEETLRWMLSELTDEEWAKVRISSLDFMEYYPAEDSALGLSRRFRVCHPADAFSGMPLNVSRTLAAKYNTGIISGHNHHFAMGFALNGRDLIIEGGGFFNKARTEYIQKTNKNHEWVQGFVAFKDSVPTFISPGIGNDKQYR